MAKRGADNYLIKDGTPPDEEEEGPEDGGKFKAASSDILSKRK